MTTPAAPAPAREVHTDLPATARAPRQARLTIRSVLQAWGLATLASDAELLTSELVTNAAEHAHGDPIGLTIRQHTGPAGQRGILCQITDTSPDLPHQPPTCPGSERGRGLRIVTALATSSGVTATPPGKTAWFTLTTPPSPARTRQAEAGL
jgi:anti-sigma regulatory factor (Ser/Thr protein kinase)